MGHRLKVHPCLPLRLLCINHMALSVVVVLPSSTKVFIHGMETPVSLSILHPLFIRGCFSKSPGLELGYQKDSPTQDQSHLPCHWVSPTLQAALRPAWKARLLLLLEEIRRWSVKTGNPTETTPRASEWSKAACLLGPFLFGQYAY